MLGSVLKDESYGYSFFSGEYQKEPDFDDYGDFQKIFAIKANEAINVFKSEEYDRTDRRRKAATYDGLELFKKIVSVPGENQEWELKR